MQRRTSRRQIPFAGVLALLATAAVAGTPATKPDLDNGREINGVCAGCHGEYGEGGKQGEYPRLAGQPTAFLVEQLLLFRERKRPNLAMVEYIDERQMPDPDIRDIAVYLSAIELPTRLPPVEETAPGFDALARLQAAQRVLQIPRAPGDVEAGRQLYRFECAGCHGRDGRGDHDDGIPMLSGQYTAYLWRQVPKYLSGVRIHDPDAPDERLLAAFSEQELRDIFAYVSTLDD